MAHAIHIENPYAMHNNSCEPLLHELHKALALSTDKHGNVHSARTLPPHRVRDGSTVCSQQLSYGVLENHKQTSEHDNLPRATVYVRQYVCM